jgi:hypothetical protein
MRVRSLPELAEDALSLEREDRVSTLVDDFNKVVSEMWSHARDEGRDGQWVARHPITRLWAARIGVVVGFVNQATLGDFEDAALLSESLGPALEKEKPR